MIETRDLIEFIKRTINYDYPAHIDAEYAREIVTRLKELDERRSNESSWV